MAKKELILSVVVVSYNTRDLTLQTLYTALENILASPLLEKSSEVFVVDNNSTDGSQKALREFAASSKTVPIKLIANKDNVGFARANNQALKIARGKLLLLLNSDTYVQTSALEKMVSSFSEFPRDESTSMLSTEKGKLDRLGILSASLLNWDGTYQPQGGGKPTLSALFNQMFFFDDLPGVGKFLPSVQYTGKRSAAKNFTTSSNSDQLIQKYWVAGTAMMIHRDVIAEIGPLDENIFMYGEDIEFCIRAHKHHWDVAEHPNATISHFASASSSSKNAIIGELRGYYYIWSKHKPLWQLPILRSILRGGVLLRRFIFGTILRRHDKALIYKEAYQEIEKL